MNPVGPRPPGLRFRAGRARRELIVSLVPPVRGGVVVDVGADHGHVAHAIGAIATERAPHRIGRRDVPWVVGDGLSMFRRVDVAVIAGMGALSIAGILARGPRPEVAVVVHAQDDPPVLRRWLAANGWRIDAEGLAPEAGRWAEVIRAVPGEETATGMALDWGPRLLEGDDPHLAAHLAHLDRYFSGLAAATEGRAEEEHARFTAIAAFVRGVRVRRGFA